MKVKFNPFKNDRSTILDEIYMAIGIVACIVIGLFFFITHPHLWIITANVTRIFGLIWIVAGCAFIPVLIYRLVTNEIDKEKKA